MLTVEGLNTYYGRAHILADLALKAETGEVVVLLGRNGAGKSTTMKSVIGLVPAESGSITFDGGGHFRWFKVCDDGAKHLLEFDNPLEEPLIEIGPCLHIGWVFNGESQIRLARGHSVLFIPR